MYVIFYYNFVTFTRQHQSIYSFLFSNELSINVFHQSTIYHKSRCGAMVNIKICRKYANRDLNAFYLLLKMLNGFSSYSELNQFKCQFNAID